MSWLTGGGAIDWAAIVGTAFCLAVFFGFIGWAAWDKFRPQHGEHFRPIGEPPAVVESAVPVEGKRRSPFAPKEKVK